MEQGLIQSNQPANSRDDLTPEKVKEGISIPPELQEAYEKVVAAGMTVMFSKDSNKAAIDTIKNGQGSLAQRLGMGIAGLLGMIAKEANDTLPPQVIIPAGVELLIQAADFLRRTGMEEINNAVIGDAMDVMITAILKAADLDITKIVGFIDQRMGPQGAAQGMPAAPMAGPAMGA